MRAHGSVKGKCCIYTVKPSLALQTLDVFAAVQWRSLTLIFTFTALVNAAPQDTIINLFEIQIRLYLAGGLSKGILYQPIKVKRSDSSVATLDCHSVYMNGNMVALLRGCNLRRLSEICVFLKACRSFNKICYTLTDIEDCSSCCALQGQ